MKHFSRLPWFLLLLALSVLGWLPGCAHGPSVPSAYAQPERWAYEGIGDNRPADLFLVAPTVYLGRPGSCSLSLDDAATKANFLGALNMERGIYDGRCRLFAPYYRQAGLNAYSMPAPVAAPYFELAYADVREAFLYYLEHHNQGRPLVLAGFSQGADMALRLLKEFGGREECRRLVAAYLIGWRITPEDLAACPHLRMAQGESDLGVVVAFECEAPSVHSSVIVPRRTLGINPLNWKADSSPAAKELNAGACFTDYSGAIVREVPQLTGAYLDPERGTLKVPDVSPADYPPLLDLFAPGVYHVYDYQFFYRNLQKNVGTRVDRWLQENPGGRR